MRSLQIYTSLIIGFYTSLVYSNSSLQDTCSNSTEGSLIQYRCGSSIYIRQHDTNIVTVDCGNKDDINMVALPKLDLSSITELSIINCPNIENFNLILQKLNITATKSLQIKNTFLNNVVKKETFNGLDDLERLRIMNKKVDILPDFLANVSNLLLLDLKIPNIVPENINLSFVSNLKYLDISMSHINYLIGNMVHDLERLRTFIGSQNNIVKLPESFFRYTKNLDYLDLSHNKIEFIEGNSFNNLQKLNYLNFRKNNINNISRKLFKSCVNIHTINFGFNPNLHIENFTFSNFTNLTHVILDYSNLENLPENIFQGSTNIKRILLNNNKLTNIQDNTFANLEKLEELNLSSNNIKSISDTIFSSVISLTNLYLENNFISELNQNIFSTLVNLKVLNLKNNNISAISTSCFKNCTELQKIDLSYNRIKEVSSFKLTKLYYLNLAYNEINYVHLNNIIGLAEKFTVDLSDNIISHINFSNVPDILKTFTVVNIMNNPIECDCLNLDFIRYLQNMEDNLASRNIFFGNFESMKCTKPLKYSSVELTKVKLTTLGCKLINHPNCPRKCDCFWKPFDNTYEVNCSFKNFTKYPVLQLPSNFPYNNKVYNINEIDINLEGNFLKEAPPPKSGYENVTKLYLSNNEIEHIAWISSKIKVLLLDNNKLKYLDEKVLKNVQSLSLHKNPWKCDCSSLFLQEYLLNRTNMVNHDVLCEQTGIAITLTKNLCKSRNIHILVSTIVISLLCAAVMILVACYYRYKCGEKPDLEEEPDIDFIYDVFVSVSSEDNNFVMENIITVLETPPDLLKVYVYSRDFTPGEIISKEIANCIHKSRRFIIVLSKNFLNNNRRIMEFRTAYSRAISAGRSRIIVLLLDDVNIDELNEELKAYLQSVTYIKWGDPWFWLKLKRALRFTSRNRKKKIIVFDSYRILNL